MSTPMAEIDVTHIPGQCSSSWIINDSSAIWNCLLDGRAHVDNVTYLIFHRGSAVERCLAMCVAAAFDWP